MKRVVTILGLVVSLWVMGDAPTNGQPSGTARPGSITPHRGVVVWWGGGDVPDPVFDRLSRIVPGGTIAVVTAEDTPPSLKAWAEKTRLAAEVFPAATPDLSDRLQKFDLVWIETGRDSAGVEILDKVFVSTRFLTGSPDRDLETQLTASPGRIGVGIPGGTALVATGRSLEVIGESDVVVCLPASVTRPKDRPVAFQRYKPGSTADLIALSRAASARLGPQFPARTDKPVEVSHGTLLACGGGELPDSIWQRFVELAGGVAAPIVVIPIASPTQGNRGSRDAEHLKRLGCRRVTVLNHRTPEEARSPDFCRAMQEARGVWLGGGRQWRYVDAFEESAEPLFHEVLKRNGVIGGSSAGAAIQAEYMVRGSPLGNLEIMAEGYERGLNLLPGCAIDIHVTERNRVKDVVRLVETYPELLGIAIDEKTAVEIRGSVLTVLGDRKVQVVDSRRSLPEVFQAADRYDLATRTSLP